MILPMKKVFVLVLDKERENALSELRRLGLVHIESRSVSSGKLTKLYDSIKELEEAKAVVSELMSKKDKKAEKKGRIRQRELSADKTHEAAEYILSLAEEKKSARERIRADKAELDRLDKWGELNPEDFQELRQKGIGLVLCELPTDSKKELSDKEELDVIFIGGDKNTARAVLVYEKEMPALPSFVRVVNLPKKPSKAISQDIDDSEQRIAEIDKELLSFTDIFASIDKTAAAIEKDIAFEANLSGMELEELSPQSSLSVALLCGYIPEEDLDALKELAKAQAWGLTVDDPTVEDNVPTKLRNNKFVSLIYPLTDFLGTVPGYFEYDISGWLMTFMLIFFGIIFGDGGYGLLITGVAAALIIKKLVKKQKVEPLYLLLGLFGLATVVWGTLTCTWFGIPSEELPKFLQDISLPLISNVNEARIWYPPWTNGEAGLTTAQNLQIFCFLLALVQLSVAHIKNIVRYRRSLRLLGDLGSIMELLGMFYVVLTLVVNSEVFGLDRVIGGVPVGKIAVYLIGAGFVLNFVFSSYEGSLKKAILASTQNIISMLLGVVNVFSDIVSYIRLWAVGLAGAAISATVNEIAGPMLGHLGFMIVAVILLVFGHGLNMVLNVLSVIVHGVRLNTLEFSSHLGMSWGGHKYEPFRE